MSKLNFMIRPVEERDARDINVIRRSPDVAINLIALPSESIQQNLEFLSKQTQDDHLFVAETVNENKTLVIGLAGLHVKKLARQRHSAILGLMVHGDFQGKGVGTKLMETLVDLADNWLLLKRLELTVYTDNLFAIKLYENFGFVKEGTMKYAVVRRGELTDSLMMARYHKTN